MKKLILVLLFVLNLAADDSVTKLIEGKQLLRDTYQDQFEKQHKIGNNVEFMIMLFSKEASHKINEFLENKPDHYLSDKKTMILADISRMPSFVRMLFAMPDLRDKNYPILLITDDEEAVGYVKEDDREKIMLVKLENKIVKKIQYFDDAKMVMKEINEG